MTNREMLEFAAKAAGIDVVRSRLDDRMSRDFLVNASARNPYQVSGPWNPIADDGDAMRLMVRLRLEPRFLDNSHSNGAEPSRVALHNFAGIVENIDGDPLAATRRAIVRAAAEIGRNMK